MQHMAQSMQVPPPPHNAVVQTEFDSTMYDMWPECLLSLSKLQATNDIYKVRKAKEPVAQATLTLTLISDYLDKKSYCRGSKP